MYHMDKTRRGVGDQWIKLGAGSYCKKRPYVYGLRFLGFAVSFKVS